MDLKLAGKTALITGGSKGIGRATAEVFAAEGCNVIIVSRTAETLAQVKSAIAQKSNVRVDTGRGRPPRQQERRPAGAGFSGRRHSHQQRRGDPGRHAAQCRRGELRKAWDLKVFGYVNMCRRFYALMKERKCA